MAYYCKKGEVARRNVILRLGYRWRKLFRKFIQRSIMAKRKHSFFIDKNSFSGQVIKDKQKKKLRQTINIQSYISFFRVNLFAYKM